MCRGECRPAGHGHCGVVTCGSYANARPGCGVLWEGLSAGLSARSAGVLSLRDRGRAVVAGALVGGLGCCSGSYARHLKDGAAPKGCGSGTGDDGCRRGRRRSAGTGVKLSTSFETNWGRPARQASPQSPTSSSGKFSAIRATAHGAVPVGGPGGMSGCRVDLVVRHNNGQRRAVTVRPSSHTATRPTVTARDRWPWSVANTEGAAAPRASTATPGSPPARGQAK